MRVTQWFLSALLAGYAVPVWAAFGSMACQAPTVPSGARELVIDARSGAITGPVRFRRRDRVQISLTNKNPFRFRYKLTAQNVTVEETALTTFVGFISTFTLTTPPAEPPKPDEARVLNQGSVIDHCDTNDLKRIKGTATGLDTLRLGIETAIRQWQKDQQPSVSANNIAQDVFSNEKATCGELVSAGNMLLTALTPPTGANGPELTRKIDRARLMAELQVDDIRQYQAAVPGCAGRVTDILAMARDIAGPIADHWADDVGKLIATQKKLDEVRTGIEKVAADGSAFVDASEIGDYDSPTNVTVTLTRTDLLSKSEKTLLTRPINFGGGQLFTIGIGAAASSLPRTQFQRIQGFARNRDGSLTLDTAGQPVFGNIVGTEEVSGSRITPMLTLHGRLIDSAMATGVSVGLTFGITAKTDNKGTNVEYLIGPSLGLIDDRMFLTIGAYGGRTQSLDGNFYVGAPLPDKLTELPIRRDLHWRVGFALTLKAK